MLEVELLIGRGGFTAYRLPTNSECQHSYPGVRLRVLRSVAERGTTQTIGQGPQVAAKLEKRGAVAETARRFAWKQQFL